jgi:hypothetical protein
LNDKSLHTALKDWYARPEDLQEVPVDGYVIDVVRDDLLIEIQTRSFAKIKKKLLDLVPHYSVLLAYPVAQAKWIVKLDKNGQGTLDRRKSPKRGTIVQVFEELVSFPTLLAEPNFSLEVLLTQEEETRSHDPRRGWRRRGWVTQRRHLVQVVDCYHFDTPQDMASLLPSDLQSSFTTSDLASALGQRRRLAQRMAYCLREMAMIVPVGKRGNAILYERVCS